MKKIVSVFLLMALIVGLTAFVNRNDQRKNYINTSEQETEPINIAQLNNNDDNILIAYFSWANNTIVDDEKASARSVLEHYESIGDASNYDDTDVMSSASVVTPGNVAKIALWIQQYTGGDLYAITVEDPYPSDYDTCMDRASDEKASNARPILNSHIDNMEEYDVIFLGFPNWWSTVPMAVLSFIDEYDLSGKIVIPFCSHGTGGIAASVNDITDELPDSTEVLEAIGVYRADINASQPVINDWLIGLGFEKKEADAKMQEQKINISIIVNGQKTEAVLDDTPAARALYKRLPLELNFEDFNGMEKIGYLSDPLPTDGEPEGCETQSGDLCLYEPWGNLSVFYKDFRYSKGLIKLGHIESGMDIISNMPDNSVVKIEKDEQ